MMISLRLQLTVYLCALIIFGIGSSLYKAYSYQEFIYNQLDQVMRIQLNIDNLRSQLWIYQEYSDELSLKVLNSRQANLARELQAPMDWDSKQKRLLNNLNRLNTNTRALINTQLPVTAATSTPPLLAASAVNTPPPMLDKSAVAQSMSGGVTLKKEVLATTASLLQARYNMIIQEMTEDVFTLHHMSIQRAKHIQRNLIYVTGVCLLLLTLLVTIFSYLTLGRFKSAIHSLVTGVKLLAKGDLNSKIEVNNQDEFSCLAQDFNDMKASLKGMTIKKEELKREVEKQTGILTEQKLKLKFLAEHDELTGIFNRRALIKQVDIAIARAIRSHSQAALLFIDLNDFKIINDTLGHAVGDKVIMTIAKRIHNSLRNTDIVGRLGGDEFVIWLDVITQRQDVVNKILQLKALISEPITVEEHQLTVGASFGVSLLPTDGNTSGLLLRAADTAMYHAKEHSKTGYHFFEDME
ncbi:diguanylate cyclase domain-containing protein [Shewanella sp. SR44-3]|uniref:diguanylate cyclase domain-containing protein n=2 Tax=Shewanella TaxID=22 RepID=UPI0015F8EF87|nr:diguanylate cyclase [Shewanella sp. SR44-3]MBB1269034.1 diguanylate cyclase [Shewanella sp. SR44-3]